MINILLVNVLLVDVPSITRVNAPFVMKMINDNVPLVDVVLLNVPFLMIKDDQRPVFEGMIIFHIPAAHPSASAARCPVLLARPLTRCSEKAHHLLTTTVDHWQFRNVDR